MLNRQDVLIVSVFGRGNWLAQELASRGVKVALADASKQMGRWAPEDWEGPFGYFRSERLFPSQIERLVADEFTESVSSGFVVWLKNGPIEMKGAVTDHSLSRRGLSEESLHYLQRYPTMNEHDRESLKAKVLNQPFAKNWLAQLAHHLPLAYPVKHSQSMQAPGWPMALFDPFYMRRPSRKGFERGLEECERKGVSVLSDAEVIDASIGGKQIDGVEIRSESHSGIVFTQKVIWMLSSEETNRLGSRISELLFPKGHVEPDWLWMRFRLSIEDHPILHEIPNFFVAIEDQYLDWNYENFSVNVRTVRPTDLDSWIKIPAAQRFHRAYVAELAGKLCTNLSQRLAGLKVECLDWPQDYQYDYEEVGAPRHPLFSKEKRASLKTAPFKNLYHDGPEQWEGLDWESQFRSQSQILVSVFNAQNHESLPDKEFRGPDVEA